MPLGAWVPLFAFLFETPLAACAAAAGAAAIPIVIHLLNRKRFRIVPWAAMRFLLAAQRKNTRRLRLEQWLLLAVRTLLVVLLVAAMAAVMPWAEALWWRWFPEQVAHAAAGSRRTHRLLVLDGSFSMAARVGETSAFERAQHLAAQVVTDAPAGDGFSVVLMANPPRRIVPEPSGDAHKVAEEIEGLRLPHGNADLAATLNAVDDLLRASPAKFEEREVYFFTDLQRSTWTARSSGDPLPALQRIAGRARSIFVDVGQEGLSNTAVTNLALGVPFVTTRSVTPVSATVHNYGAEVRRQANVELLIGKARAAAGDPTFEWRLVRQKLEDLKPGPNTISFDHTFAAPGDYALQVRIDADSLDLDDRRMVVVRVKDTVPVMVVNGKVGREAYDGAADWLADALNPFPKGQVPRSAPARPQVLTLAQFADAGTGDLSPFDCVFLCDVPAVSPAEAARLEAHLRRGGGVIVSLGPQVDLEAYNRVLYRTGEGLLPVRLVARQEAPDKHYFNLLVEAGEKGFKDPPLAAFAGAADQSSLLAARFRNYLQVEFDPKRPARKVLAYAPETASASASMQDRSAVKSMRVGDAALVEETRYRGRLLLLTSTVNMDWTSWPISPSYPALMQELLHFAVAGRLREQEAGVGDVLEEWLQAGGGGLEVEVRTPDGRAEASRTELRDDVGVIRWADTEQSGLYRATVGQYPQEYLFAVNVPTATDNQQACESDLARTNSAELQSVYPGWDFQLVTDLRSVVHTGGPSGESDLHSPLQGMGRVIARWLLLCVLVLLVAEVVLAWRFGRATAGPGLGEEPPRIGRLVPVLVGLVAGLLFVALAGVLIHAAWTGDFLGFLPEAARSHLESRLGIPPPAPGEGTRWHLEFTPYLRDAATDPWLVAALALCLTVGITSIYLHEGRSFGKLDRLLLGGLRLFTILLTLAVLLPQIQLAFEREGWPDLAIIVDDSQSMGASDRYQDEQIRAAVQRLAEKGSLRAPDRLPLVQTFLTQNQGEWLERLLAHRRFKLHVYHCSSRAARLADVSEPPELESALTSIRGLHADGESSQLGTAVRQVLNDFRGSSLAAIVMFTDGVTTEGEDLNRVARYAGQMGVPLFFAGLGDAHDLHELKLHDLQVDDTVHVNDNLVFEARLSAQGYSEPRTVTVSLSEKDRNGNLRPLDRTPVTIDPQGRPVKFRLAHKPSEPGEKMYVIEVPPLEDEAQPAENHRLERSVFVKEAKLIHVLYIEGYARYEYRFIKNLLERESDRDRRNKTIDLHVLLMDADNEYATEDRSALADFPTREELNAYDVVILGDVDPKDRKLGEKGLQYLADFVRERGGGFLMIAGPRYSPHAYKDTPLRDILPIQIIAPVQPEGEYTSTYRPDWTSIGRFHPIFRFVPDEAENAAVWNHLAEMYWWSEGYRPQPAAEVLLVHPRRAAADARRPSGSETGHPLLVQQFVGAGRSMFLGFDETWRWRFREDELRFNQFWIQMVRYLARSRLGRIELRVDRQVPYRRGEPIKLTVRFPDDAPPPGPETRVEIVATRSPASATGTTEKETIQLAKVEGSRATYEAVLTRTPVGEYRFWLSAPVVADPKPHAEARVLPPPGEMELLKMNQPEMERAARETHGKFYTLADVDRLPEDLPAGTRITLHTPLPPRLLWNHSLLFALTLGLLTAEWTLRKRRHLL